MRWISSTSSSSSKTTTTMMIESHHPSSGGGGGPTILDHDEWKVSKYSSSNYTTSSSSSLSFLNATTFSSPSLSSSPLDKLKVPLPIYIPSLPKSGTTSLHRYFICGQIWTAHTFVNTQDLKQLRVGECIQNNLATGRAPLDMCGTYKVFGDDGVIRGNRCYYPSLHGALPAFAKAYADGFTLLYIRRSSQAWISSMRNWKDGNLLRKWKACQAPFPQNNRNATDDEWMAFYEQHAQSIRQFAKDHADTITFIEVNLEDEANNIAQVLQDKIGIDASCWGHHNSHEKRLRLNPKFRAKAAAAAVAVLAVQSPQEQQQQETK
jgi:hypothetical protein